MKLNSQNFVFFYNLKSVFFYIYYSISKPNTKRPFTLSLAWAYSKWNFINANIFKNYLCSPFSLNNEALMLCSLFWSLHKLFSTALTGLNRARRTWKNHWSKAHQQRSCIFDRHTISLIQSMRDWLWIAKTSKSIFND